MEDDTRNDKFLRAYDMASTTELKFPPDVLLHFYAYYKRATEQNGFYHQSSNEGDLKSAFKINALLQVKDLTKEQAKQKYIDLVEEYIGKIPS